MATYRLGGRIADRKRLRQRQCEEWGRCHCHGPWVVWIWTVRGGDDRAAGDDLEYTSARSVARKRLMKFLWIEMYSHRAIWRHLHGVYRGRQRDTLTWMDIFGYRDMCTRLQFRT